MMHETNKNNKKKYDARRQRHESKNRKKNQRKAEQGDKS
jgi:hypothetical protein